MALLLCPEMRTRPALLARSIVPCVVLAACTSLAYGHPRAAGFLSISRVGAQAAPQAAVFPKLASQALDKTVIMLPEGLEGRQNLLLLSFRRDQGPQLDTWTAVSQALQHTRFDFRTYRMLVSDPENALFRWWDNSSLRATETDPDLLHWDVPLYTNKAALRESLVLPTDDRTIVVLLVDRSGHVLWMDRGSASAASRASLLAASHALP